MPINNDLLVLEFQKGNTEAFKKIHEELYEELYRFARRLTSKNEEACDIVADVFEKLWNLRSDFETFDKIRAFLLISVRNACMDYLRSQTNRSGIKKKLRRLLTDREDPFYRAEKIQEAEILATVLEFIFQEIGQFPMQMRQIFEMRIKNMEYTEIANELNTSVDNVRHQMAAGISRLRKKLKLRRRWMLLRMLMRY